MKAPNAFSKSSRMTNFSAGFWPRKTPRPTLHVESIMALPLGLFLLGGSPNQALPRNPSLPLLSLHLLLHLPTSSTPTKMALRRIRSLISWWPSSPSLIWGRPINLLLQFPLSHLHPSRRRGRSPRAPDPPFLSVQGKKNQDLSLQFRVSRSAALGVEAFAAVAMYLPKEV